MVIQAFVDTPYGEKLELHWSRPWQA